MTDSQPTLKGLAAKVAEVTEAFTRTLEENKIPEPTFAADSPTSYSGLTGEMFLQRQQLLDHLNDMIYLVQGPSESIFNYAHNCMPDVAALNILNHFDFWSAVPLAGSATYSEIALHTSLPEEVVTRVIEHATTLRIFEKTAFEPGTPLRIRHTSRSAALAKSAGLRALVSTVLDDAGPPMTVMQEALRRFNAGKTELAQDMTQTAFALYHSGALAGKYANSWEFIENDGEGGKKGWRQRTFVQFMDYIKEIFRLEDVVENAYDWKAAGTATVVDLGGSGGHDSIVLARKFPDLSIVVQDLPQAQPVFEKNVPADLKERVTYSAHDFFNPQPVQADVYMIKLILHDWPDKESVQILRGLVPALKPGARVLFIDYVGKQDELAGSASGPPLPRSIQQFGTSTDLRMLALFSAKERPVGAWKEIFRQADERFELVRVEANPLTFMVIIEAVWRG
ncbi:S-adenosyl-L-methionine-dependent methyltransferase [Sodiomyces alkalinus F11]|uniref:S-adenosyl-L-methionine-dependent methyltransferase n=1 Tax=Sodiomyces alkalinus (strain CBS 110278 / VKM F-3762 / F11) TaxID=1314773 RepID=A0A3N2PUK9_SODAK|nr:S-adenosyl-L-methionine-dependent methyltransferase [Sodiomyces alkalinus F11]ROT38016.1 S-adenosyl-L-methionine-dependent methyltransferase [Sodiomyces alkalinus F11]